MYRSEKQDMKKANIVFSFPLSPTVPYYVVHTTHAHTKVAVVGGILPRQTLNYMYGFGKEGEHCWFPFE